MNEDNTQASHADELYWFPGPQLPTKADSPTPDQSVFHARTHFNEKWDIFSMAGTNSRNIEKRVIFQAWVREISEILLEFIFICCSACLICYA